MRGRDGVVAVLIGVAVLASPGRAAAKGECSNATYYTPSCASPGACGSQYSSYDPDLYQCWIGHPQYCFHGGSIPEARTLTWAWQCKESVRTRRSAAEQCGTIPDEICGDGIDNDQNGCVDDGCELTVCGVTCVARCEAPACTWPPPVATCKPPPPPEICGDGVDNDCDGVVDETCQSGGKGTTCSPVKSVEVCGDFLDNDCDGVIDEGCPPTPAGEQVYFHYTDPAGTPLAIADTTGKPVWRAEYAPFGEEQVTLSSLENNRTFVAKEKDVETGLSYFGARYYEPATGRFLSTDPVSPVDAHGAIKETLLANPQQLNPYAYGANNPYRHFDPSGGYIESPLDAAFVAADVALLIWHTVNGDEVGAAIDKVALGVDLMCLATPGATGGGLVVRAGGAAARTAARVAPRIAEEEAARLLATQAAGKAAQAAQEVAKAAQTSQPSKPGAEEPQRTRKLARAESPFWKRLDNYKNGLRRSGKGKNLRYYEWDHTHGDIELYDAAGKHLGTVDPVTGQLTKPAVPGRNIKDRI